MLTDSNGFIPNYLKYLEQRVQDLTIHVSSGGAETYEDYKEHVGRITELKRCIEEFKASYNKYYVS